jgi:hypothetical protein
MKSLICKATEIRYTTWKAGDVIGEFMSNNITTRPGKLLLQVA